MRVRRFDFSMKGFKLIFGPGRKEWEVTKNPIPPDAEVVKVVADPMRSAADVISLFVVSDNFPDVPEGTVLPAESIEAVRYQHSEWCECSCFQKPEEPCSPK